MKPSNAILTLAILLACSCNKEQLAATYNNQETKIEKYLDSKMDSNKKEREKDPSVPAYEILRNSGSNRLVTKRGTGEGLRHGGSITFHYAGYEFINGISSDMMFETNDSIRARTAHWNIPREYCQPRTLSLNKDNFIEGLYNGLTGVKSGEECEIVFSGKYGMGNKYVGNLRPNAALIYCITVKEVSN